VNRYRLIDWRHSGGPEAIGLCGTDDDPAQIARVAQAATRSQQRLLMCKETGDEGWWGSWAEVAFQVSRTAPYLTTPRGISRIEAVNVCDRNITLWNQFYEYLEFGNGRMPKLRPFCDWPYHAAFTRNNVPTFLDINPAPQFIQVVAQDPADIAASKTVLIQGIDVNGNALYNTPPGLPQQIGTRLVLQNPFSMLQTQMNSITGIQKDVTQGPVQFFQIDPNTGAAVLLLTMEPTEQTANYRRYFFNALPATCCGTASSPQTLTITAICKLEPLPLVSDTDYFLLQGDAALEAITLEAQAIRYSKVDESAAKTMSSGHHKDAVQILNGILANYMGVDAPAVLFKPFGSATLRRKHVGMI